jgi:hypothetical protein
MKINYEIDMIIMMRSAMANHSQKPIRITKIMPGLSGISTLGDQKKDRTVRMMSRLARRKKEMERPERKRLSTWNGMMGGPTSQNCKQARCRS